MLTWREFLSRLPLVAILRGVRPGEAVEIGEALHRAGFLCVEVPLNSPEPFRSISALRAAFDSRMLIGAGTVLTAEQAVRSADAGAQLIVSPNTDGVVIRATKAANLVSLPGVLTPSEAFVALEAGADALKLFPAEIANPAVLKALSAVLPSDAAILPVGGIDEASFPAFLAAGASGFGLGGSLYRPGAPGAAVFERASSLAAAFRTVIRP